MDFFMPDRYSTDSSDLTKQSIKEASYKLIDRFYRHWREDEGVKRAMEQQQIH
jgi:hypothetical protein